VPPGSAQAAGIAHNAGRLWQDRAVRAREQAKVGASHNDKAEGCEPVATGKLAMTIESTCQCLISPGA
jgi:hypothetical protein